MSDIKKAEVLYPEENDGGYFSIYDYQPIINCFGKVILQVDDYDYQGDTRVLYKDYKRYGYLNFGWGSCTGCDSLQACENYSEVDDLIKHLNDSIKWFDSIEEMLKYFREHDWEGDYSWRDKEQKAFVAMVLMYCEIMKCE